MCLILSGYVSNNPSPYLTGHRAVMCSIISGNISKNPTFPECNPRSTAPTLRSEETTASRSFTTRPLAGTSTASPSPSVMASTSTTPTTMAPHRSPTPSFATTSTPWNICCPTAPSWTPGEIHRLPRHLPFLPFPSPRQMPLGPDCNNEDVQDATCVRCAL